MSASIKTLKGGTQLAFDSAEGITNIIERTHESIVRRAVPGGQSFFGNGRAQGLTASAVYASIRGVNNVLRTGIDKAFGFVTDTAPMSIDPNNQAEARMASALNGVIGDHLEATGNALAIPMSLTSGHCSLSLDRESMAAALPEASPHIVVLVHGLGLSDFNWQREEAPCMGSLLGQDLGHTPLYLRYNTGRHISTNGQEFAQQLEQLCEAWPVPIKSLSLIGHSMGGLVIRSTCWYAQQSENKNGKENGWLSHLQRIVCLGTPHHGSFLEKAGHALDMTLQKIPFSEPFAFGKHRSAGIKDLRHGNLLDEDWQGRSPDQPDTRRAVPLLTGVDYYFAAATLGRHEHDPLGLVLGDLLVRLDSAVGSHQDNRRHIPVKRENCRVFHEKNHFDLLSDDRVHRQIINWFEA